MTASIFVNFDSPTDADKVLWVAGAMSKDSSVAKERSGSVFCGDAADYFKTSLSQRTGDTISVPDANLVAQKPFDQVADGTHKVARPVPSEGYSSCKQF